MGWKKKSRNIIGKKNTDKHVFDTKLLGKKCTSADSDKKNLRNEVIGIKCASLESDKQIFETNLLE